jgi:hypothetical protein
MKTLILPSTPIAEVERRLKLALDKLCGDKGPWTWDDDNREAKAAIERWIAGGDLRQLPRLNGPSGTGKSRLIQGASQVLLSLHGCGIRTLEAVEIPAQYVKAQKGSGDYIANLADPDKYPLLIIEDIGLEKNAPSFLVGDTGVNVVAQIVQLRYKRWEQGMPLATGFTDNLTDATLMERYDERCVSRMAHMTFYAAVTGDNRRANSALPRPATSLAEIPKQIEVDPTSPEVLAAVDQVRNHMSLKRRDIEAAAAKRRKDRIEYMQQRIHRMTLAELHEVIQADPYEELRSIARNRFDSVSPVKYSDFLAKLESGDQPLNEQRA